MGNNLSSLDDFHHLVWVDGKLRQEYYPHGYNYPGNSQLAFARDIKEVDKLIGEMQMEHPGRTMYVMRSIRKIAYNNTPMPQQLITETGEVVWL